MSTTTTFLQLLLGTRNRRAQRARFIEWYAFPEELRRRFAAQRPKLSLHHVDQVLEGLRQYFLVCLAAREEGIARHVGMPSKAVDEAWHEFIVMTREYAAFCQNAFGEYLHHTPHAQLDEPIEESLANTLHQLRKPPLGSKDWERLRGMPLTFALDRELSIADGYLYDAATLEKLEERRRLRTQSQTPADVGGSSFGTDSGLGCDAATAGCDAGSGSCGGGGGCGS